jgi:two-component system, NtrC family, response regulator GlrR
MPSANVLVIDACAWGSCEHFGGLQRWLTEALPRTRAVRACDLGLARQHGNPDVLIVHAAADDAGAAARTDAARLFPHAKLFVISHTREHAGRFCVPEETIDALRSLLPHALGALPFQVLPGVIGCSAAVCKTADEIRLIAGSEAVCLLHGETGTGKELFARAIHYLGERKDRPFVPVNCGAIQDTLFENEMFGHVRGAFTDARNERAGLLAHAESGTIFLDEVDCLSAQAQVKVLRVLQEREYRPVGSSRSVRADVRIIAATNTDLRRRVQQQLFREDLFHRLNVLRVFIPPLRDRPVDLPLLARTFVRAFARRYQRHPPALTDDAYRAIEQYEWPGNVREMQAVLERAVLLARGGSIAAADLDLPCAARASDEVLSMKRAKEHAIEMFERVYLRQILARCAGNVSLAARVAGKERRSFQRLLRKHNLTGAEFRGGAAREPHPAAEKP